MSEKNVEEVKSLLKEIKSKFFESYVDYLFAYKRDIIVSSYM